MLKGRKHLGQGLRLRFARVLGLGPVEQEYFDLLVQADRSRSSEEKAHYRSRLARFHGSRPRTLDGEERRFFDRWWYAAVWHWFGSHPDQANPARIAKAMRPALEAAQVEEAIRVLLELKLIKRLANGYAVTERHLAASPGFRGEAARERAREHLRLAIDALDGVPAGEREFRVQTLSLSARGYQRIRDKLESLLAEAREWAATAPSGGERVYALAAQLYPFSEAGAGAGALPARGAPRNGLSAESGNPQD